MSKFTLQYTEATVDLQRGSVYGTNTVNINYVMFYGLIMIIFLNNFRVQAVRMEEKVRKGAYVHLKNKWGSLKSKKKKF